MKNRYTTINAVTANTASNPGTADDGERKGTRKEKNRAMIETVIKKTLR